MTGPAATVAAERERFLELAKSFREAEAAPAPDGGQLAWDAPPEWEPRKGHPMRLVTFAPRGAERTECFVTILPGTGGGTEANLQLWREQMGQPRLSAAEIGALERVPVLGRDGKLIEIVGDYTDVSGNKVEKAGLLGVVCEFPGALLTVKMTGPLDVLEKEKARFRAFCGSLRRP
jgi:hypothetical protein